MILKSAKTTDKSGEKLHSGFTKNLSQPLIRIFLSLKPHFIFKPIQGL